MFQSILPEINMVSLHNDSLDCNSFCVNVTSYTGWRVSSILRRWTNGPFISTYVVPLYFLELFFDKTLRIKNKHWIEFISSQLLKIPTQNWMFDYRLELLKSKYCVCPNWKIITYMLMNLKTSLISAVDVRKKFKMFSTYSVS